MKKIAAAYIRVSTDDQLEFSPDSQIRKIREYAERNNIHIPDEYIFTDEGISGRKAEKRPAFMEMISLAKTRPKPFDIILVWKFSRFARNREDSIVYKSMLRKQCKIDVISVSEQIGEDKTSILIEALLEAMDEYYSINLAEEVKRGMNEKFSRGGVVTAPPFGYKMGDGRFIPDDETAPVVRMIFDDYISGLGMRKIATKLNDMGIKTRKGNSFQNRNVEYILTNPTYIGKLRRNTDGKEVTDRYYRSADISVVDGQHEPIISDEVFKKAGEKLSENRKHYNSNIRKDDGAGFMLKGLVRCSSCGATLVNSSNGTSLQCHKYARGQCRTSHSITIKKLNSAVIEKIKSDLQNTELCFMQNTEIYENDTTNEVNENLLRKEEQKLERIKEAYLSGIDTLEEYRKNKSETEKRIRELKGAKKTSPQKEKGKTIRTELSEIIEKLKSNEISENEKNRLLSSVISDIIFDRKNMTIRISYHKV
ncbi:MAG: recombinase family protein [Oscillospiraceae bacterium]|nr:recombinase family protein [Oscillospiraceae bacterium]